MQNKVVVFGKLTEKLEDFLHERGIFDALSCFNFDDCICLYKNIETENIIVLCNNNQVDALVEKIKSSDDKLSLINEQAVKLERQTTYKTTTIVPIEADVVEILSQVLDENKFFANSVFGKSEAFLIEKLSQFKSSDSDFIFKIDTKSKFLHTVYTNKQISNEVFEGGAYSSKNESLSMALSNALAGKTISIAEYMTMGALTAKLTENVKPNVAAVEIVTSEYDFKKLNIDENFLAQNGAVGKETAFAMAKNLLKNKQTDLAISVTGFDCDAGRTYVAVGNKNEIHVFSSIFYGDRQEIVESATDFAIFKAICFLKEKYS